MLQPGTLRRTLELRTRAAIECGALRPLTTRSERIDDGGIRFIVRRLTGPGHEDRAGCERPGNPFLPYDEALFVADVSANHVALLNKFNVIARHMLIVTRQFEDQTTPLTPEDFEAWWRCMREFDSLGFYNGGTVAGASQPHKHLQVVPLPLVPEDPPVPVEAVLRGVDETPRAVEGLAFRHLAVGLAGVEREPPEEAARRSFELARRMFAALGAGHRPYNLLMTRRWMLLVPRRAEGVAGISVNALGFAGSLFVRDEAQIEFVRRRGPMAVLGSVGEGR